MIAALVFVATVKTATAQNRSLVGTVVEFVPASVERVVGTTPFAATTRTFVGKKATIATKLRLAMVEMRSAIVTALMVVVTALTLMAMRAWRWRYPHGDRDCAHGDSDARMVMAMLEW